jgi:ribosome maturation factor RimP
MELKNRLAELANQSLPSADHFLVDIVLKGTDQNRKVIVLLDGDKGINIDDCAKVSRGMAAELELNDPFSGKYTLEVSSAGIDHPLTLKRQYAARIGKELKIRLVNGDELAGELVEVHENDVVINKKIKVNKKQSTEATTVSFDTIDRSMVQVSFK